MKGKHALHHLKKPVLTISIRGIRRCSGLWLTLNSANAQTIFNYKSLRTLGRPQGFLSLAVAYSATLQLMFLYCT